MKIIIADDEKWVRATIISQIPFDTLGMTMCSEASNGIEALELCRQYKPDILITDIQMPGLSGLELIEELKYLQPHLRIVIISGYDDFEYARTALKFGVSSYILKPVNKNELTNTLLDIKSSIEKERQQIEQQSYMRNQYKLALPVMCEQFLNRLLVPNSMTVNNIIAELAEYHINFCQPYYAIVVFSVQKSEGLNDIDLKSFKILLGRIMKRYLNAVTFVSGQKPQEFISIVNHKLSDGFDFFDRPLNLCRKFFDRKSGGSICIGISLASRSLKKSYMLYEQALDALQLKFWSPESSVFFYDGDRVIKNISLNISDRTLEDILFNMKIKNYEPAYNFIDGIYFNLKSKQNASPVYVKSFFTNLINIIALRLDIYKSFIEYESMFGNAQPYEKVNSIDTLDELVNYIKGLIAHACEHYCDKNSSGNAKIIDTVKRIMEQNYFKDISLEQISKYVNLNPTYFSELFKKETEMSFVYYKTFLRVENAKKLLLSTGMSVSEISEKVGYNDHKYFGKLFKKVTGMTLSEYKRSGEPV